MEIEVRVVRARVWLSSSLFLHQDGLLSLTRVGEAEHVAHATLRSVEGKDGLPEVAGQQGQQKCYRTVTLAWEEQGSNCPKFSLPEATPVRRKTNQQTNLPRLDFQLFLLRPRSSGEVSARSKRLLTVYIGASGWQLSDKDVEALASSREVVFLTTLQDDLGTLEVKLRCVSQPAGSTEGEAEAPTGFNINWGSSEALQKDLAEKARLKSEADKKLISQLTQTAVKAAKLLESRDYLLVHFHRSCAASRIQRRFRLIQRKKQEIIAKLRRQEEARIAAKKAKVRDKVVARNHERALAMRARLLGQLNCNNYLYAEDAPSQQEAKRITKHFETERAKLKQKLAVLEMERQKLISRQRDNATRNNLRSMQLHNDKLFDEELVRAVQELHFTRTYSTRM
ncbi:hypothetical protein V7S43_012504 [Phytophthora oleae]|uniref:Uncharacterized protein n=1 Tax=Phytophthora oleae TaxID=2107226 RepID=A0ABD3F9J8_9STRA